uniref:EFG_II domain-containing protein n=1 Tax=Macrostomum lignano TaxID=282301 RepID=A0A1I8FS32_9PLAT
GAAPSACWTGAILVLCAVGGVQSQTLTVNRQMLRYNVPLSGLHQQAGQAGRQHLSGCCTRSGTSSSTPPPSWQLPVGLQSQHEPSSDLVDECVMHFDDSRTAQRHSGTASFPAGAPRAGAAGAARGDAERRQELVECVANAGLSSAQLQRRVFLGTALRNKGVQPLLGRRGKGEPDQEPVRLHLNPERSCRLAVPRAGVQSWRPGRTAQLTYFRGVPAAVRLQGCRSSAATHTNDQRAHRGRKSESQRLVKMHANEWMKIKRSQGVYAGDICARSALPPPARHLPATPCDVHGSLHDVSMESDLRPGPVVSMSIKPKSPACKRIRQKACSASSKEDPTLRMSFNEEFRETILHGELHLEIYAQSGWEREYKAPCVLGKPKVAFRETLSEPYQFDYLHKKQSAAPASSLASSA